MKADSSEQTFQGVLLADIGGTNARFAILADGMVREITRMAVSDYRRLSRSSQRVSGKTAGSGLDPVRLFLQFPARYETAAVSSPTIPG